jgi:quinol monooxygenase YgiN
MLIIVGRIYVVPEHREEHVASLEDLIRRARAQPGCPDFVIAGDPVGSDRVNLIEQWESQEHLAAWRAVAHPSAPVAEGSMRMSRSTRSARQVRCCLE